MQTYHINADSAGDHTFSSDDSRNPDERRILKGSCARDTNGVLKVTFEVTHKAESTMDRTEHFSGHLQNGSSLLGHHTEDTDKTDSPRDSFVLRRVTPAIMRFRPSPDVLADDESRPSALWYFAMKCILEDVRRRTWSWSYFAERRKLRRQYVKLSMARLTPGIPHPAMENMYLDLFACRSLLAPSEVILYESVRKHLENTRTVHAYVLFLRMGRMILY